MAGRNKRGGLLLLRGKVWGQEAEKACFGLYKAQILAARVEGKKLIYSKNPGGGGS